MSTDPDFATKPVLRGTLAVLRPFHPEEDVSVMARILSDPEVRRLTGSVATSAEAEQPYPVDDRLREWYRSRNEQTDRLDLAVEDAATGRLVGEVVLNEYDAEARSCNLRCLVGPEGRGRGLGTEALVLLVGHAFDVLGLRRLTLEVFEFNPRARHVYERLGFVATGTREDGLVFDGVSVGAVDMELTAQRWAASRGSVRGR